MTAAPAPVRLRDPLLPAIPDDGSARAAGPGDGPRDERGPLAVRPRARVRLQLELDLLPQLLPGCHHASASTITYAGGRSAGSTDDTAIRADALQHELAEGPGLHAVRTGHSVLGHDLRTETRWPLWCERVRSELGLEAALSVLLSRGGRAFGTLTLYGDRPGALSDVDLATVHGLAGPLARTLAAVRAGR